MRWLRYRKAAALLYGAAREPVVYLQREAREILLSMQIK